MKCTLAYNKYENKSQVLLNFLLKGTTWESAMTSLGRLLYESLLWIKAFLCETSHPHSWSAKE